MTPLHLACKYGQEDVAELLINQMDKDKLINFILNETSINNNSDLPLHFVCKLKDEKIQIIKHYLNKINVNNNDHQYDEILKKQDYYSKQTILHLALENNHLNIAELIFQDYINNNNNTKLFKNDLKEDKNGNLLIHLAARLGSIEILNLLRKYDAISFGLNNKGENALHVASQYNRSKFIHELLKYESYLMNNNEDCDNNNTHFIQCICKCKIDSNNHKPLVRIKDNRSYTPLLTAISNSNQKCVEILIQNEYIQLDECIDSTNGNSIYHICIENDNYETLKHLIENNNNNIELLMLKNNNDETLLHVACRKGNQEITSLLMNKLSELNLITDDFLLSKNKAGQNCFHLAVQNGYFNLIEYFLKKKKLLNFVTKQLDNQSNTCLHLAALNGHLSLINLLLDHNDSSDVIYAKNGDNMTALDLSCSKGYFEITKRLICNSNNQIMINEHNNLLHLAAKQGEHELVKLLLFKGIYLFIFK
jgi:ankyrin repeat protein